MEIGTKRRNVRKKRQKKRRTGNVPQKKRSKFFIYLEIGEVHFVSEAAMESIEMWECRFWHKKSTRRTIQGVAHKVLQSDITQTIDHIQKYDGLLEH